MPLVVPGVHNNLGDSKTQEWTTKLMGKTVKEGKSNETNFSKNDLPQNARIIEYGHEYAKDQDQDRLNVALNQDGTVSGVHFG